MEEMRYTISDAAKMVKVESHVLRYWEDELSLEIPRNEMGHRYYTQREIDVFCRIRALKDRGFQLKSIKDVMEILFCDEKNTNIISLEDVRQNYEEPMDKKQTGKISEEEVAERNVSETMETMGMMEPLKEQNVTVEKISSEEKMSHFKYIMDAIVSQALRDNNVRLEEELVEMVTERLMNEMSIVEQQREQKEEARFRKLDETIRGRQRGYQEVAAAKLPPYTPTKMNKRRFGLFRK